MPPRRKSSPDRPKGTGRPVISAQLKKILESSEHTLFAIARDSGVGVSNLSRFLSGERDITVGTLDRIADVLGLRLVESGKDKVRPSKSPRPNSAGRRQAVGLEAAPPLSGANLGELGETPADGQDSMVAEATTPQESPR